MAEYDLTKRMVPFFDPHLVIPLLEFIEPREVNVNEDIQLFKLCYVAYFLVLNALEELTEFIIYRYMITLQWWKCIAKFC